MAASRSSCSGLRRICVSQGGNYRAVGVEGVLPPPGSLCQPPTNIFPILLGGVNRNPTVFHRMQFYHSVLMFSFFLQILHTIVVHCSCLAFRTDIAMFVFRTLVKFTSSILSLSRVSRCIMINYN